MSINHFVKPLNIDLDDQEFTPNALISAVNEKLTAREAPLISIKGICAEISDRPYYGHYFGKLIDPDSLDFFIKIKIAERLRLRVKPNALCTMRGFVEKQISYRKDGNIGIVFCVKEVISTEICKSIQRDQEEQGTIIADKQKRRSVNVKDILVSAIRQKNKARVLIIAGEKSVAFNDVLKSLGNFKSYFNIEEKRVNFRNKEQICDALSQIEQNKKYDIAAIVRGGGDGLEVFSDTNVLKAAAAIKSCCLVTALGHYEDQSAVDRVADYVCGTPTDFGYFLSRAAAVPRNESSQSKIEKSNRLAWTVAAVASIGFLLMLVLNFK